MANQRILASEEMVGYGHGSKADTLNRLSMIEHGEDGKHVKVNDLTPTPQTVGFTLAGGTTPKTLTVDADFTTSTGGGFAAGTKMLFYADTAPTGWTIDNTLDDKAVYITKGSAAGGQTGGGAHSAGTWTQPNHTHTGPSHTHTTAAMTLDTTRIPAHTHTIGDSANDGGNGLAASKVPTGQSGSTGGGSSHEHGATGADGTGNTGNGATANTWRPAAYCMIICSKN